MDLNILFFFILPLAVIIFSVALERLLDSPVLVSAIIFIIFITIAFVVTDLTAVIVIAAIAFTILSFLTALISCILSSVFDRLCNLNNNNSIANTNSCTKRLCCKRRICSNQRSN